MRSVHTVAIVMIFMGAFWIFGAKAPLGPGAWILSATLVAAGAGMFTRKRAAFVFAMIAAALLSASGIVGLAGAPELGLPVPPALSLGVGLYLSVRVAMTRRWFT